MEPRLTDEQLEAALNDQLDPAFADHPVASFFREGAAAFDAVRPGTPSAALSEFLGVRANADLERSGGEAADIPIIASASVIEPVAAETKPELEIDVQPEVDENAFRPAVQPLNEEAPLWAPVIQPVFDEERAFPENPYELSTHVDETPDAEVYWLDADRDRAIDMEPEISESSIPHLARRRTAILAAVIAAIVGGAQATGTMDLLPRRVVDMAAGHEGATLNEGRKPTDPSPEEIGDADDDRIEPVGEDTPADLETDEVNKPKANLRPVQRGNQSNDQGGAV